MRSGYRECRAVMRAHHQSIRSQTVSTAMQRRPPCLYALPAWRPFAVHLRASFSPPPHSHAESSMQNNKSPHPRFLSHILPAVYLIKSPSCGWSALFLSFTICTLDLLRPDDEDDETLAVHTYTVDRVSRADDGVSG